MSEIKNSLSGLVDITSSLYLGQLSSIVEQNNKFIFIRVNGGTIGSIQVSPQFSLTLSTFNGISRRFF